MHACMHACLGMGGGGWVRGAGNPVSEYMRGVGFVVGSMYADSRRIDGNLDAVHGWVAETHGPMQ